MTIQREHLVEPAAAPDDAAAPHITDLLERGASGEGRMRFEPSGIERSLKDIWADSEIVAMRAARSMSTLTNS